MLKMLKLAHGWFMLTLMGFEDVVLLLLLERVVLIQRQTVFVGSLKNGYVCVFYWLINGRVAKEHSSFPLVKTPKSKAITGKCIREPPGCFCALMLMWEQAARLRSSHVSHAADCISAGRAGARGVCGVLGSNHFSMHISADPSTTVTGLVTRARLLRSLIRPAMTARLKCKRAGGLAYGEIDSLDSIKPRCISAFISRHHKRTLRTQRDSSYLG